MRDLLLSAVPPVLGWFRAHRRDLPWRHGRTPYTVLVAELMLQQTRVEAVRERYAEFLLRFPTAEALARASEEEVLKAWEGLGYYSRARNLHAAAKRIAAEGFPSDYAGVRALPGVGDYTAGAVCSIALGLPVPAVDGNVVRVLSRLFADGRVQDAELKREYAALLEEVYPPETGDFAEALMELGATVCLPGGAPLCGQCPWKGLCRAEREGNASSYPVRPEKRERKKVLLNVYVLRFGEEYALRRRGEGLLAGLWEFPNYPAPRDFGETLNTLEAKHVFTHVEWHMTGRLVAARERFPEFVWADSASIAARYAVPSAFKAFLPWIRV